MYRIHRSRRIATTLIILILVGLSACQSGGQVAPSVMPVLSLQTTTPTATALPGHLDLTAESLEGQDLTLWSPWLDDRGDQLGFLIEDFNQSNAYGINISLIKWGGEMALTDALTSAMIDPDGLPDIFIAPTEEAFRLQQAGLTLQAMDDYLISTNWGLSPEEQADLIEPIWQLGQTSGSQYGVPAETDAQFLFYNLTWGLELGFNGPPRNREEFLLQSCKAGQANLNDEVKENNGTGGWLVTNDSVSMLAWLSTFDYVVEAGAPYTFNLPETKSAMDYLKNLVVKNCAWIGKASTPYEYFTNRYALIVSGSLEEVNLQRASLSQAGSTDQWVLIPYPRQSGSAITILNGSSYFIVQSDATRQMAAWVFLRWMNDPVQQLRLQEVLGSWPSRQSVAAVVETELSSDLIYSYVFTAMKNIRPRPHDAEWNIARRVFEDAAWQLFQPETRVDQIPALLADLDATIAEILALEGE